MTAVYLDYNATAPIRPEAAEAAASALAIGANPSSVHAGGRAAHAAHQPGPTQPREQLLQVGLGNFLTVRDLREGHGAAFAVAGEVGHGHDGVAAFGGQAHRPKPEVKKFVRFGALPCDTGRRHSRDLINPSAVVKYLQPARGA